MISNNNRPLSADDEVFNPQLEFNNPNRVLGSGSQAVDNQNPYFQEPTFLDKVTVALSEEERRRANTSDAPLSFFEKLQGGLQSAYLWDDPVGYRIALEDSNRRGDSMIRGLAKAGTGLVDLATTAVQYSPPVAMINTLASPEPTTADRKSNV